jgi:hypothetical protein
MSDSIGTILNGVLVFIDDILIYSANWKEHLALVKQVFQVLQEQQLKVKLSKCKFAHKKLAFRGHEISAAGVATDISKIQAIKEWQRPTNAKGASSFLGMVGYYRSFVKNFGIISRSFFEFLKKGVVFAWSKTIEEAFQTLKQALILAPVLALPNSQETIETETDACDCGIGAVLMQKGYPISFLSKSLGPKNRGLSTYEKECLAILMAVDKWRPYLQRGEFDIRTDQKALTHLDDQRLSTPWQHRVLAKLLGLHYKILCKKGHENRVGDVLSCNIPESAQEVAALSVCEPTWHEAIKEEY